MTVYDEQMDLLRLVSKRIRRDLTCYAFGGTAMMFYGYKDETKDIDLLFEKEQARNDFIDALEALGFRETSPIQVYIQEKMRDKSKPLIFKRDEARFDLFVKKVFRTRLSPRMKKNLYAVHQFKGKKSLTINVLRKEHIVQLKAITDRQHDFDDIRIILSKEKKFDWKYMMDGVIWQHQHGDTWAILDTEKMMQELKKYIFIEKKYFDMLYKAQSNS